MTKKELITLLAKYPDDIEIIISTGYSGEFPKYMEGVSNKVENFDCELKEVVEEKGENTIPVVVVYPEY